MEYSLQSLVAQAEEAGLAEAAIAGEIKHNGLTREGIIARMDEALQVMRQSAQRGFDPKLHSMSRMTGGQAAKLQSAVAIIWAGRQPGRWPLRNAMRPWAKSWPRPRRAPAAFCLPRCLPRRKRISFRMKRCATA